MLTYIDLRRLLGLFGPLSKRKSKDDRRIKKESSELCLVDSGDLNTECLNIFTA